MLLKFRSALAIVVGLVAWFGIAATTDYLLVTNGFATGGVRYAILGAVELLLGGAAVLLALRFGGFRLVDIGWTSNQARSDFLIGLAVAFAFAALQFFVIIPATGGAARSDVAANAAQIGEAPLDLSGILVLALLGSTSEELLFRGLILGGIATIGGRTMMARVIATIVTVALFALSHGYQGWAGIVDTGVYGGLLLSLLYWWRGARLIAPIAAHAGWNIIAAIVIFIAY
ncbi:MAG: CPBP family intramembrane metalloprotease [Erythrobacter sp.]|nr:CPBP family intramembrane metalloprotease [Erythrobacter sp.]